MSAIELQRLPAGQLTQNHIGHLIRFHHWDDTHKVAHVVTCELRQILHQQNYTRVFVGETASTDYCLDSNQNVIINPVSNYGDVAAMLGNDKLAEERAYFDQKGTKKP